MTTSQSTPLLYTPGDEDAVSPSTVETNRIPNVYKLCAAVRTFGIDIFRAWCMLLTAVVWPIGWMAVDAFVSPLAGTQVKEDGRVEAGRDRTPSQKMADSSFAERFKYILCTSCLLTSSLAISSYDTAVAQPRPAVPAADSDAAQDREVVPSSTVNLHTASLHNQARPTLQLTESGKMLFRATFWALVILTPISPSRQAWVRSIVLLICMAWGAIATMGMDQGGDVTFQTSHQPAGSYSLRSRDKKAAEEAQSEYLSTAQAQRTKEERCLQVTALVSACKSFDVECNKTIAAVQEVELVARGFKLSHPLPPISRIEASKGTTSPPRLRNASWTSPANAINASRLSRSSSSGASAASGWKHHGPRPQSNPYSHESTSANGRSSPQEADAEPIRMATLRKALLESFEEARRALQTAQQELEPLVDMGEMCLLQDMYELDTSTDAGLNSSSFDPTKATARLFDARSSWAPISRSGYGDESSRSIVDDGCPSPTTPQRLSLLSDHASTLVAGSSSSTSRKRDSGTPESWSVASPSRDTVPIRAGSRLSYISDKTPSSSTPNQTAATKRLSYVSTTSTASPLQAKSLVLNQISPALTSNRKRASLLSLGMMDESHRMSIGANRTEAYLIASLKASFEKLHLLRKQFLCQLLALDFTLKRSVQVRPGAPPSSALAYWAKVAGIMQRLTVVMKGLTSAVKQELQQEMNIGQDETAPRELAVGNDSLLLSPRGEQRSSSVDCAGVEERLMVMGQALRSVQVKMRACAEEMKLRLPSGLHGTFSDVAMPTEGQGARSERSEKILETIREDLLTLSAEWETALKILRAQRCATPNSAIGETTSSTINSSRLDSPQEAEEDALRQWITSRKALDESDSSDDGRDKSKTVDEAVLQWSADEARLTDMLIASASPDDLPPPGMEKVYESMGEAMEARMKKSGLSRDERIRLAKEQRSAQGEAQAGKAAVGLDASAGMIQELQAVMKSRKTRSTETGEQPLSPPLPQSQQRAGLQSPLDLVQAASESGKFRTQQQSTPAFAF